MFTYKFRFSFFATVLFLASCSKTDLIKKIPPADPAAAYQNIGSFTLTGTTDRVDVYRAYDSLFVGYNTFYFKITDTAMGKLIPNATITISPVMNMGMMQHSCPTDQPVYLDSMQLYKAGISFLMSSTGYTVMGMGWTIPMSIKLNGQSYNDTLPVMIKDAGTGKQFIRSAVASDGNTYYVVLVHPWQGEQVVGMNNLEVAVYKKNSMFDFPAVDNLSLSFVPTMPSMGHSSPNNINPTGIGNGHYAGKVNFTMTGDWQLDFTLSQGGTQLATDVNIELLF